MPKVRPGRLAHSFWVSARSNCMRNITAEGTSWTYCMTNIITIRGSRKYKVLELYWISFAVFWCPIWLLSVVSIITRVIRSTDSRLCSGLIYLCCGRYLRGFLFSCMFTKIVLIAWIDYGAQNCRWHEANPSEERIHRGHYTIEAINGAHAFQNRSLAINFPASDTVWCC